MGTLGASWYDMRVILEHTPADGSSALFRALNPETWIWAKVDTQMLAHIATASEDSRFLTASQFFDQKDFPDDYLPHAYGPRVGASDEEKAETRQAADDRARSVADEIRAEMSG